MESMKHTLYMMIGMPASGKSHFAREFLRENVFGPVRVSADDWFEQMAELNDKTYDEVWSTQEMKRAEAYVRMNVDFAMTNGRDIVWDQTNLTKKSRAKKLASVPGYRKVAIVVECRDDSEWRRRLVSRPGKTIPEHVLTSMALSYELPTEDEGFGSIIYVNTKISQFFS